MKTINENQKKRAKRMMKEGCLFSKSEKLKKARIIMLKKRARRLFFSYQKELLSAGCGARLAELNKPRVYRAKVNFNKVMDELRELESTVQKNARL